jgi:hypothetical protein
MRFDLQKIDERIKKLQEIRKLATDPEGASLLLEFMSSADEQSAPTPVAGPDGIGAVHHSSEAGELVNEVVNAKEAASGGGLWTRTRG